LSSQLPSNDPSDDLRMKHFLRASDNLLLSNGFVIQLFCPLLSMLNDSRSKSVYMYSTFDKNVFQNDLCLVIIMQNVNVFIFFKAVNKL